MYPYFQSALLMVNGSYKFCIDRIVKIFHSQLMNLKLETLMEIYPGEEMDLFRE